MKQEVGKLPIEENCIFTQVKQKYQKNKGYITLKLNEPICIGDTISLEKEDGTYHISELLIKDKNVKETAIGQTVTIGRMKGNINLGDKIYITTLDGKRVEYTIYDKFVTTAEDVSYIKRDTSNKPEITLSCCTDDDEYRIIILAKI